VNAKQRWAAYPRQVAIALDQFLNAIIPPFFTVSWADETMSARLFRGWRDKKIVGRLVKPPVDAFFALWQKPDPEVTKLAGREIHSHCEGAYWKEKIRRDNHPEYREGEPAAGPPTSPT
jgi:hypothetical protein